MRLSHKPLSHPKTRRSNSSRSTFTLVALQRQVLLPLQDLRHGLQRHRSWHFLPTLIHRCLLVREVDECLSQRSFARTTEHRQDPRDGVADHRFQHHAVSRLYLGRRRIQDPGERFPINPIRRRIPILTLRKVS